MVDSRYYSITHSFTTIHLFEPISWFPALDIYTDIYTDIYGQPVVAAADLNPMTAAAWRQGEGQGRGGGWWVVWPPPELQLQGRGLMSSHCRSYVGGHYLYFHKLDTLTTNFKETSIKNKDA